MVADDILTVCVSGAAGQIAYSLLPLICSGSVFGARQKVKLHLLEIPSALRALSGVVYELEDAAYPLLTSVVQTSDVATAFTGARVIVLVGAFPRRPGMTRFDLSGRNAPIFASQGAVLAAVAHPDVRVLIVGNPANTNALVLHRAAKGALKPHQVTALTMLDHNRTVGRAARLAGVRTHEVHGCYVWGNHSATQYPDVTRAEVNGRAVVEILGGFGKLRDEFIPAIQKRGDAISQARGLSSALSAAKASADHLRAWMKGSETIVSMAVYADGEYDGIARGVWYSFPVRCKGNFSYEIVTGLHIDDFSRNYLTASANELYAERDAALKVVANNESTDKVENVSSITAAKKLEDVNVVSHL